MKSSNNEIGDLVKNYFKFVYKPREVIDYVCSKPVNIVETFIVIIISSVLLISGVFIVGCSLYTTFHEYAFTYPLEILTSGQIFGFYLPFDSYVLVFLTDIIFCIKAWLFLSVLLFIFLRIFKQEISIKQTAQIVAWSIFTFAIVMLGASLVCLGFKYLLPAIYQYIYFGILAAVFIVFAPVIIYQFLERYKNVSIYNALRSYYLSLLVVLAIFTFNHADKFMNLIW